MQFDPVETIELVREYAKQETVGPLKGAGRWLAFGLLAAFCLSLGIIIVLVGVLRLSQDIMLFSLWPNQADGLSFMPYVITLASGVAVSIIAWSRVKVFELNRGAK